jgi:16S rRNA (cytidine1402-2'-O)-methyltransferase
MPLYVIATPIGNLEDVTYRAISTLKQLDLLLCEDTRVTRHLLDRYEIKVPYESYREEVHRARIGVIIERLKRGEKIGIVSDAGTPAVSDPGSWLVRDVLAAAPEVEVIPIPGPSAVATAISIAGMPGDEFVFLAFPPHKKGRQTFFKDALAEPRTVVMYESTHRIDKALAAIEELDPSRPLVVCRELTKMHETVYRGTAAEIRKKIGETSSRGEFVIVISKSSRVVIPASSGNPET